MNSQYMTSYWSAMVTMGPGSTVYEIQTNDLEFDLQGNGQNMLKITFPHFLSIFKKKIIFKNFDHFDHFWAICMQNGHRWSKIRKTIFEISFSTF